MPLCPWSNHYFELVTSLMPMVKILFWVSDVPIVKPLFWVSDASVPMVKTLFWTGELLNYEHCNSTHSGKAASQLHELLSLAQYESMKCGKTIRIIWSKNDSITGSGIICENNRHITSENFHMYGDPALNCTIIISLYDTCRIYYTCPELLPAEGNCSKTLEPKVSYKSWTCCPDLLAAFGTCSAVEQYKSSVG